AGLVLCSGVRKPDAHDAVWCVHIERVFNLQETVNADFKLTLPQFWCNLAVGWRNLHESREPLCDCFAWGFAVCGDFFEVAVWSFGIRSCRRSCPVKCVNGGSLREQARLRAQASRTRAASVSDRVTASLAIDC